MATNTKSLYDYMVERSTFSPLYSNKNNNVRYFVLFYANDIFTLIATAKVMVIFLHFSLISTMFDYFK